MNVRGTDRIACKDITATNPDDLIALMSMPAIRRLGFVADGEMAVGDERFQRFRRYRNTWESGSAHR